MHTYTYTRTRVHVCRNVYVSARVCTGVLTPTRLHALRTVHTGEPTARASNMPPSLRWRVYAVCGKLRNKVEPPRSHERRRGSYRCRCRRCQRRDARFYRAASLRARRTNSRGRTKGTFVKGEYRKMRAAATSKMREHARRSARDYLASRPFFNLPRVFLSFSLRLFFKIRTFENELCTKETFIKAER